jgi:hypothetical protein
MVSARTRGKIPRLRTRGRACKTAHPGGRDYDRQVQALVPANALSGFFCWNYCKHNGMQPVSDGHTRSALAG